MTNAFKLKVFLLKDPIQESNQLMFTKIELKCQERRKLIIFIKIVSTLAPWKHPVKKIPASALVCFCPRKPVLFLIVLRRRILIYLSTNFFTLGAVY